MKVLGVLCFVVLAASGCTDTKVAAGSVDGKTIFASACARCHGADGIPTKAMMARTGAKSLLSPSLQNDWTDDQIRERILQGSASRSMPAFKGALSEEQLVAIVAYIRAMDDPKPAPATQ